MTKKVDLKQLMLTTRAADDTGYVAFAEGQHAIVQESEVDILLMLAPQENEAQTEQDRALIRVKVWSKMKPNLCSFTDIMCKGKSQSGMERAVDLAAGVLCERQAILYGDMHDSRYICRKAAQHYRELCAEIAKQRR